MLRYLSPYTLKGSMFSIAISKVYEMKIKTIIKNKAYFKMEGRQRLVSPLMLLSYCGRTKIAKSSMLIG